MEIEVRSMLNRQRILSFQVDLEREKDISLLQNLTDEDKIVLNKLIKLVKIEKWH